MTASPQDVVEAVYARLTGDSALNTALGGSASVAGRVYHQVAIQNDAMPLLIFDVLDVQLLRSFGTTIGYQWDLHFDLYVDRAAGTAASGGAGTIDEHLFDRIDDQALVASGLDRAVMLFTRRGVRTIEEDAIRVSSDARVFGADI